MADQSRDNATRADQAVVDNLRMLGADIEQPREIEFFLYFPTEDDAGKAASLLAERGFKVQITPSHGEEKWLCFATIQMMPDVAALMRLRKQFNSLADQLGGEYDGWGTGVIAEEE